jgi:murein DD-endopeptidase MepM/ murein hydrolase activator NlpD
LQHATVVVRRAVWRVVRDPRRAIARLPEVRRSSGPHVVAPGPVAGLAGRAPRARAQATSGPLPARLRRLAGAAIRDLSADRRGAPILVLCLVLLASLLTLPPGSGTALGKARPAPGAAAARIAALAAGPAGADALTVEGGADPAFQAFELAAATSDGATSDGGAGDGGYAPDGTLLKPFAVAEVVGGIDDQVRSYRVRSGDTLGGIAAKFDLKMSTLFWANKLTTKDTLHVNQVLDIPPTDGVLYLVKEGDTIETIAVAFHADIDRIITYNHLAGDVVVIGETIMVPDGRGKSIPATPARFRYVGGTSSSCGTCSFSGALSWPVDGWYFISQHYWSGHPAIDIASTYGTAVVAAASGKVIRTGWVGNGGYAIWISNGNGVYMTYNHLSYIGVSAGQYVSRGTQIGRVGSSGHSTGPHLHFEIWVGGPPYEGHPINPLGSF